MNTHHHINSLEGGVKMNIHHHINSLFLMHRGDWDSNPSPTSKFALPSSRSSPPLFN